MKRKIFSAILILSAAAASAILIFSSCSGGRETEPAAKTTRAEPGGETSGLAVIETTAGMTDAPSTEPDAYAPVPFSGTEYDSETSEIPFETRTVYSDQYYEDERFVSEEGKNGVKTTFYEYVYENGELISEYIREEITRSPSDRVETVGTKSVYTYEEVTEKVDITPYGTVYRDDPDSEEGNTRLLTGGSEGYTENTYKITYIKGTFAEKELIKSAVISPCDEIYLVGTKKTFGLPYVDLAHGGIDYNVTQDFSSTHRAIDFGVYYGDPIVAVMSGTVIEAKNDGEIPHYSSNERWTYGTYVVIDHGNGFRTYYAHLSSKTVKAGDKIAKGDVVGYSGNTGRVIPAPTASNRYAGTHLHFEIRVYIESLGVYRTTDPKLYLPRWTTWR